MTAQGYEFWLIGVPVEEKLKQFEKLRKLTKKQGAIFEFNVPKLRIGTLDMLFRASSDFQSLENMTLDLLSRKVYAMRDLLKLDPEVVKKNLQVEGRPMPQYIYRFHWCEERIPLNLPIPRMKQILEGHVAVADAEVKKHLEEYVVVKGKLDAIERAQRGSLMTRNISQLVKKEDFVLGSENLMTAVVVVQKALVQEWLATYELLDEEVVPRSTKLLYEEHELCLYSVTLFKRKMKEFMRKARDRRFFVRDFVYDEGKIQLELNTLRDLRREKTLLEKPILRLFKTSFSDLYVSLGHIYAIRLFVECILLYGLPLRYLHMLVVVPKPNVKKLKQILCKEFSYLDKSVNENDKENEPDNRRLEDFYPYVYIKLKADLSDF